MPNTNIQSIDYSDNQDQIIGKLNNNFDEIVELHGGTLGNIGPTGPTGAIGERGEIGITGMTGPRGTRWFISTTQPAGGFAQNGDYWIDSNTSEIYILELTGWQDTGYNIRTGGSLFSKVSSTYSTSSGTAIQIDQVIPKNYLFVLSDVTPESGVVNELLSKFIIANDSSVNDSPLLEFSRSDQENGTIADYSLHPIFYWPASNPSDNTLGLRIPGGAFTIGLSGGLESNFDKLKIDSQKGVNLNYGITASSGIFATGGYSISASSEFNIRSKYLGITGGSASFLSPIQSIVTVGSDIPLVKMTPSGTGGFKSTRVGDTYNGLSSTVYHLNLESSSDSELFLNTKGKLRTKKTAGGVTYSQNKPAYQVQSGATSWFFISRTSTPYTTIIPSTPLNDGNIVIINPAVLANTNIGIGLYDGTTYGWGGSGGLLPGESIDISVYNSSDSTGSVTGFKYIGVGTGGTGGTAATKVTLPFFAKSVDLTLAKGITGSLTTVYWKAYTPWGATAYVGAALGGTGGSFTY